MYDLPNAVDSLIPNLCFPACALQRHLACYRNSWLRVVHDIFAGCQIGYSPLVLHCFHVHLPKKGHLHSTLCLACLPHVSQFHKPRPQFHSGATKKNQVKSTTYAISDLQRKLLISPVTKLRDLAVTKLRDPAKCGYRI